MSDDFITRREYEEMWVKLFGNRKPQFEDDMGEFGKIDRRLTKLERVLYGAIGIVVFLQIIQPYVAKLGIN